MGIRDDVRSFLQRFVDPNGPRPIADPNRWAREQMSEYCGFPKNMSYPLAGGLATLKFEELIAEFPDPYKVIYPGPADTPNLWRARLRALMLIEPGQYLVDLLGTDRPFSNDARDNRAWMDAAGLVEIFRERWDIRDGKAAMPDRQDSQYQEERTQVMRVVGQVRALYARQLEVAADREAAGEMQA